MELAEQPTLAWDVVPQRLPAGPREDTVVGDRYRLVRRLGAGGSATVFHADDLRLRRPVALKLLHPGLADDRVAVERFQREAWIARRLRHENITSVRGCGVADGTHYIAMDVAPGRSLRSLLRDEPAPEPATAIAVVLQILEAVRFMHGHGIVHRDLKPDNVVVDSRSRIKVVDFGVAIDTRSSTTTAGSMLGTVHYMSPEIVTGGAATAASDLYSVGVILYELLVGRRPFEAELAVAVAMAHVETHPEPPRRLNGAVTPALEAVVMRALEKSPSRRFRDARAFTWALVRTTNAIVPIGGSTAVRAA